MVRLSNDSRGVGTQVMILTGMLFRIVECISGNPTLDGLNTSIEIGETRRN